MMQRSKPASWLLLLCLLVFMASYVKLSVGVGCPFQCSGHGSCDGAFCDCIKGYTGVICSERICPSGNAWVAKPYELFENDNTGEYYAIRPQMECSNQGLCNRKMGKCKCFEGFEGEACQRTTCGKARCNGQGQCVPAYQLYQDKFIDALPSSSYYNNWEANQTTACLCYTGFSGPDCSYRICPKGKDPFIPYTQLPTIQINIYDQSGVSASLYGASFLFSFQGESFAFQPRVWTMEECKSLFQSLQNIASVNCTLVASFGYSKIVQVVFESFPLLPYENNLFVNNGNPSNWTLTCVNTDNLALGVAVCSVEVVNATAVFPTYETCSGRGICDFSSGLCNCFQDVTGVACEIALYPPEPPAPVIVHDILLLNITEPGFNGSDLYLYSAYEGDNSFNPLLLSIENTPVLSITGGGDMIMDYGGLHINGFNSTSYSGQTIYVGGLTVTGGTTVGSGGLALEQGDLVLTEGASVIGGVQSGGSANITGSLYVQGGLTTASNGIRIESGLYLKAGGMTVSAGGFTVGGSVSVAGGGVVVYKKGITVLNGGVYIQSGGLALKGPNNWLEIPVNGGLSIVSGGAAVTGGVTVLSGGLYVTGGGFTVNNDGLITSQGISILSSGLFVSQGLTINNNGLYLTSSLTISGGLMIPNTGIAVTGGLSVNSVGLIAQSGVTVLSGGAVVTSGGLTVSQGGLVVAQGGLSILSGGFAVTGGLTVTKGMVSAGTSSQIVNTGGVQVTGGVTVKAGGAYITGGLSVWSNGVTVASGGMTVINNGLYVAKGVSVYSGGITFVNGLTVLGGGLVVATGGLTIASSSLAVSGSVTIGGGMIVTGGLTVNSNGIVVVTGGLSVGALGMIVQQGLSLPDSGLVVSTGGLTINSNGLDITAGSLSINSGGLIAPSTTGAVTVNSGLIVVGGMSLPGNGLAVTGGFSVSPSGIVATGGLTVQSGNIILVSGSLLNSQGVVVQNGGMTVTTGGVYVASGGLSIEGGGLYVTGGLTVNNDGMIVPSMTISSNGISVTGGITLFGYPNLNNFAGGLTVATVGISSNSLFVSQGAAVTGGLSVLSAGAVVSGGLTVESGGAALSSLSISFGGLGLTGGLTVLSGGVQGPSLTVADTGLAITGGGLTVNEGGIVTPSLRIRGGMYADSYSVLNAGAYITGGLTVNSGGMFISGGLTVPSVVITSGGLSVVSGGLFMNGGDTINIYSNGLVISKDLTVYGGTDLQYGPSYSDIRLKQNVRTISDSLSLLKQIRGVEYAMFDPQDRGERHFGVLAQQVEKVLPQAVASFTMDRKTEERLVDPAYFKRKYSISSSSSAEPPTELMEIRSDLSVNETITAIVEMNKDLEAVDKHEENYKSVNYLALLPVMVNAMIELLERIGDTPQQQAPQLDAFAANYLRADSAKHPRSEDEIPPSCNDRNDQDDEFLNKLRLLLQFDHSESEQQRLLDDFSQSADDMDCACVIQYQSELESVYEELVEAEKELEELQRLRSLKNKIAAKETIA